MTVRFLFILSNIYFYFCTIGCVIEINETGTCLKFKPGILLGGVIKEIHDCGLGRSIGWFIEGILPLAIFSKSNVSISFSGVTNDSLDLSVDILRNVTLPLLQNFGIFGVNMKVSFCYNFLQYFFFNTSFTSSSGTPTRLPA